MLQIYGGIDVKCIKRFFAVFLIIALFVSQLTIANAITVTNSKVTAYSSMLQRAEAIINYEWVPSQRIYTWNDNLYNGKNYFEAGEIVRGMPYTLFSYELGFDSLLSLEQFKTKCNINYSTTKYCNSVSAERIGPAYGNCCATFVSEVFGGMFMNGSNPRYDGVGKVESSTYSTTYTKVKASALQPGDAISCTSGAHIIWVGKVVGDSITIYESTPPICRKVVLSLSENTDANGYLIYGNNTYNIVTKSNELIRDDLSSISSLSTEMPMPIHAYTKANEKTMVYDAINGNAKANKIYGTDLCFIDAVFENGWCHVNFPLDAGGLEHGYVRTSVFFENNDITDINIKSSIPVYSRNDFSSALGRISFGTELYGVEETSNAYQIIYSSTSGGFNLGWISKNDLENNAEDAFLNQFCPIKGYPCVMQNFEVKQSDYTTRGGEIYINDYCTINEIYNDGWCQVTFPMDSGGERTAYTPVSNFIYDVAYMPYSYITKEKIDVYTKKDLNVCNNWWTGIGDTIYILSECDNALQICYPIDSAYGGGYKLGWIPKSSIISDTTKTIANISICSLPTKTEYIVGEKINLSGLKIQLNYTDGSSEIIEEGYSIDGFSSDISGEKTVTVTYEEFTDTFTVTVKENAIIDENTPQIVIESKTVHAGDIVQLAIVLKNSDTLKTVAISDISFDTDCFELVSGEWKIDGSILSNVDIAKKTAVIGFENNTDCNGTLFVLTFKVKEDAEDGTYPVSCTITAKRKEQTSEQFYTILSVDGNITVTSIPTGDVNGDDEVNSDDAIYLLYYTLLPDLYPINQDGDFDSNGDINSDDAIYLLYYTLLPDLYPLN